MDFPRTVEEITPEWLTQVLRDNSAIDRENVVSFQPEPIGGDTGLAGVLHRLSLEYDVDVQAGDAPTSIVTKHSVREPVKRSRLKPPNAAEISFYKNFADEVGIDVPRMYFGAMDEDTAECVLLLEDLGHLRAVAQSEDCSAEDAIAVLSGISRVHAHYWSGGPAFDQISNFLPKSPTGTMTREHMDKNVGTFIELVGDYLPDGIETPAWKLAPKISKVVEMIYEPPITLIHGDLKTINMFFDDSVADPPRVVLYDWQALRTAKAALDVGYFISTNISTNTRRTIEHQLFESYHQSLIDLGVKNYSLDEMMYDVRVALLPRLTQRINSTVLLGETMMSTGKGMANMRALVESLQTLIDWNCDEVIPK